MNSLNAFNYANRSTAIAAGLDITPASNLATSQSGLSDATQPNFYNSSASRILAPNAPTIGQSVTPAATAIGVQATTPVADWTVLVYISSHNLESYAIQDFLEMARVGSTYNVNIVVQFDRADSSVFSNPASDDTSYGNWTDTRRGIVWNGSTPTQNWGTSIGEVNMGDASTLSNFVNWGTANYQATNYALVLWGHGNGLGTSMDESGDLLNGNEVSSALATLPTKLALVAADSCLMGTVEFAYELSQKASIFVGSQESVSVSGFEYTSLLSGLVANPQWSAVDFSRSMVSSYQNYYTQFNTTAFEETLSVINLSAVGNLVTAINQFASTLMTSATSYDTYVLDWYRDYYANAFGEGSYPSYVDIGNVFSAFASYQYVSAPLHNAAQAVVDAYSGVVIENYSAVPYRSTGLSIYFSNKGYYPANYYNNSTLSFATNTQWDEFLSSAIW